MISAVLIVRNEAEHLQACLASLNGVVDDVVVVDTGSTDGTAALAQGAGARVSHFPWSNDFAAARNFALSQARGAWVLVIDADERVQEPAGARQRLLAWCAAAEPLAKEKQRPDPTDLTDPTDGMLGSVEILNLVGAGADAQEVLDHTPRFFRRGAFHYQGAIHEQLVPVSGAARVVSTGLRLLHLGYALSPDAAKAKAARNIALLEAERAAHPHDEYLHYQLGKSHFSVRQYAEAAEALEAAVHAIDWSQPQAPRGLHGPVSRKVLTDLVTTLAYARVNLGQAAAAQALLLEHAALGHPGTQRADFPHALGYAELMLGNVVAARAAYEKALEWGGNAEDVLGTGSFAGHYHLGLLAEAEQDWGAAWAQYAKSLRKKPDYAVALRRVVDLSAELGTRGEDAASTIPERVLEAADPEAFRGMYVARVQLFLENGQIAAAGQLAKAAAGLDPAIFQACREAVRQFAMEQPHPGTA